MNVAMTISKDTTYYGDAAATLGDRIVAAREAAGYSQKKLASRLGVKLKTVQGWEEDRTEPRANKLQMMTGILGVSLVWLMSGEGEGVSEPTEAPSGLEDIQDALEELQSLRADMTQATRKLSIVEKRLRARL